MLEYFDFKIYIYIWILNLVKYHHLFGVLFYVVDTTKKEKMFLPTFFLTLTMLCTISNGQDIDVYHLSGSFEDYLKMTRHPGVTDLKEMTVCMR